MTQMRPEPHLSQPLQIPPLLPPPNEKPRTTSPTHPNPNPAISRHPPPRHNRQDESRPRNKQKCTRQWTSRSRQSHRTPKDSPRPETPTHNHQPVEENIEEIAISPDVCDFAGEDHDRGEDEDGEERRVVQETPVGACFFAGAGKV